MIATLSKLEYAVSNLFTDPACTSMPCGWNKGTRKSVAAARIIIIIIKYLYSAQSTICPWAVCFPIVEHVVFSGEFFFCPS